MFKNVVKPRDLEKQGWIKRDCLVAYQPGATLYTIVVKGQKLKEHAVVLSRAHHSQGIQRILRPSRARRIAKFYAQNDAILPCNVIGNVSSKDFYYDEGEKCLYLNPELNDEIIDGQTRVWGFDTQFNEENVDFDVIYTFLVDASNKDKAKIFYKINREQKKINPSLGFDLLEVMEEESDEAKIAVFVKTWNQELGNPFNNIIKIKETDTGQISLANITNKIMEFLKKDMGRKFYNNDILSDRAVDTTLKNYFNAIQNTFSREWSDPDCILTKSLGFGAFIELLPDVLTEFTATHGFKIPSSEELAKIIKPLAGFDFYDEQITAFGGQKGQKELANLFRRDIGIGFFA